MDKLRLKIPFIDRVGLVLDIARILAKRNINIRTIEIENSTVYTEIDDIRGDYKQELISELKHTTDVLDVVEIGLLPHQQRAEQLNAVLSSVSDGIIAVDNQGYITQYNPASEKIVRIAAADALGRHLSDIFPPDIPLYEAISHGKAYNNCEIMLDTGSHYLTSGRPITDSDGHIIGAVATLKDINDVHKMFYTVTGQSGLSFGDIIYASRVMQRVVTMAKSIARGDSNILIRGETGTGKELFARAIHAASSRTDKMFVPLNCAAIPETLLESELFGYKEGAFTGAARGGKQGLFEFASNGTIFLDEIGEMPTHLQAKLLRVLQEGKIRRIGDTREVAIDVRILAATNASLESMVEKGTFRGDLYYRLNVIPLFIPPLRARPEDTELLAQFFLQRFSVKLQKPISAMSDTALHKLCQYQWPGNIRELENVIERAINIADGPIILAEHIIFDQDYTASKCLDTSSSLTLEEMVAEVEKDALTKAMSQHHTLRQIGEALGLSHTAVLKKLRKYGLAIQKKGPDGSSLPKRQNIDSVPHSNI